MIDFLDQLREALWQSYHEEILAYDRDGAEAWYPADDEDAEPERDERQQQLEFEDDLPF